jgi:hypothetical protein
VGLRVLSILDAERSRRRATGLVNDTTLLLVLDGVSVVQVEGLAEELRREASW